jgi:hypothetical protein
MYLSDQMLRNLAPREMAGSQQRAADEQLGRIAAAVARWSHRVAARVHSAPAVPVRHAHHRAAQPSR